MKIFVTGATGFIGSHLVKELARQGRAEEITCLVRSPEKASLLEPLGVRIAFGDLRKKETLIPGCREAHLIFHLAGRLHFGVGSKDGIDFCRDNAEGTRNLLEACPSTVRRFIHMSSINAVERSRNDPCTQPITEESPCCPETPYGQSKLLAEETVRRIATEKKIPFLILRPPSIVYGPGCKRESGMARLIQQVAAGSSWVFLNFPGRFSLIHVRDLVEGTIRLGFSEIRDEVFFLSDEPPYSLSEITFEIARQLGREPKTLTLPRGIYRLADRFASAIRHLPGVGRRVPHQLLMLLRNQGVISSLKARTRARFTTRIPLGEGLRETIPWVLQENRPVLDPLRVA